MACQTRSGVAGISMCSTPSSASASQIALTTAPSAGVVPALAAAAQAERVRRRGHLADLGRERRQHVGAGQGVVHQRRRQELAGLGVVRAGLPERLAHALGDAAVRLAVEDHRIDGAAAVVHGRVAHELDHRRSRDRPPPRTPRSRRERTAGAWSSSLVPSSGPRQSVRRVGALRRRRHLEQVDGAIGALHAEPARRELDVGFRRLQEPGGDPRALLDDLVGRLGHHHRGQPQGARGMGARRRPR